MYYQSKKLSSDESPVSCKVIDVKDNNYIVEYTENGEFKTQEIKPEDLEKLDYVCSEISQ